MSMGTRLLDMDRAQMVAVVQDATYVVYAVYEVYVVYVVCSICSIYGTVVLQAEQLMFWNICAA